MDLFCYSPCPDGGVAMSREREFNEREIQRILSLPAESQTAEIYKLMTQILREVRKEDIPEFRAVVSRIRDDGSTITRALDLIDGHAAIREITGKIP